MSTVECLQEETSPPPMLQPLQSEPRPQRVEDRYVLTEAILQRLG